MIVVCMVSGVLSLAVAVFLHRASLCTLFMHDRQIVILRDIAAQGVLNYGTALCKDKWAQLHEKLERGGDAIYTIDRWPVGTRTYRAQVSIAREDVAFKVTAWLYDDDTKVCGYTCMLAQVLTVDESNTQRIKVAVSDFKQATV